MAGVNSPGPKGSAAKGAGNILGTIGTAWTIAQLGGDLFGRRKLKKGYRQIAPGIWSKVFQDTVSLNPDQVETLVRFLAPAFHLVAEAERG